MAALGYALSCEEHRPNDLIRYAQLAEQAGFAFEMISDHFHPWTNRQGNSPFVWGVLGGIAHATERVPIGTAVTCPTIRIHPAIVAQAAATAAAMMPGRFMLGVGSGENLNEHVLGQKWPSPHIRLEMLEEAIHVIRQLWGSGWRSHYGRYYTVENARIFSMPDKPPPILVAAAKKGAARLAGRLGQGLISTKPDESLIKEFEENGGEGKARYGQLTVCWASGEEEARRCAREIWPNALVSSEASTELPLPRHFEQLTSAAEARELEESGGVICGNDPQKHLAGIQKFTEAGFDHVYIHQIGPDQKGFLHFYQTKILPEFMRE
jgi:coenzyme F420-dependent glucose-6-phosphate dehydrogenase